MTRNERESPYTKYGHFGSILHWTERTLPVLFSWVTQQKKNGVRVQWVTSVFRQCIRGQSRRSIESENFGLNPIQNGIIDHNQLFETNIGIEPSVKTILCE